VDDPRILVMELGKCVVIGEREDAQVLRPGVGSLHFKLANERSQIDALQETVIFVVFLILVG
jgi:hypothetical protein